MPNKVTHSHQVMTESSAYLKVTKKPETISGFSEIALRGRGGISLVRGCLGGIILLGGGNLSSDFYQSNFFQS